MENCRNCGAEVDQLICAYCGTALELPEILQDELNEEVISIQERIEALKAMVIPEAMKRKKIELLESQLKNLRQFTNSEETYK